MRFTDLGLGGRGELKSDINVTALIAVLFVLLIILMLQFPFVTPGADLRVPRAAHTVDKPDPTTYEVTVVAVAADRRIFVNSVPVREKELAATVVESLGSKKDKTVLFMADEDTQYSAVMAAMDRLRTVRVNGISLVVGQRENRPGGGTAFLN